MLRYRHVFVVVSIALLAGCERAPALDAPEAAAAPALQAASEQRANEQVVRELTAFIAPRIDSIKDVLAEYARLPLSGEALSPDSGWEVRGDARGEGGHLILETSRSSERIGHVPGRLKLSFVRRNGDWYLLTHGGYLQDFGHEAAELRRIYDYPPEVHVDIRALFRERTIDSDVHRVERMPERRR